MIPDYIIIRSRRKSISLTVQNDGKVEVKAPYFVSQKTIETFITSKSKWIYRAKERNTNSIVLKESEKYTSSGLDEITTRRIDDFMINHTGKKPSVIRVRKRKSVWGTCNNKGVITINSFAGLLPDELFEYIMIHELTHLEVLNHNKYFWNLVSYHVPDWKERRAKLRRYRIEIK